MKNMRLILLFLLWSSTTRAAITTGPASAGGTTLLQISNIVTSYTNVFVTTNGSAQFLTGLPFSSVVGYTGGYSTPATNIIYVTGAPTSYHINGEYVEFTAGAWAGVPGDPLQNAAEIFFTPGSFTIQEAPALGGSAVYTNYPPSSGALQGLLSINNQWSPTQFGSPPAPSVTFAVSTYMVSQIGPNYYTNVVATNGVYVGAFAGLFSGQFAGNGVNLTNLNLAGLGSTFGIVSNTYSLNAVTNGYPNFSTVFGSSNGVPISVYMSNAVNFVYYLTPPAGGILP